MAGFINHHFTESAPTVNTYVIERKSTSSGRRSKEYFFFLKVNATTEERFSVGRTRYAAFNEGEEIDLTMVKGTFGFDVITAFDKVKK